MLVGSLQKELHILLGGWAPAHERKPQKLFDDTTWESAFEAGEWNVAIKDAVWDVLTNTAQKMMS